MESKQNRTMETRESVMEKERGNGRNKQRGLPNIGPRCDPRTVGSFGRWFQA